MARKRSNGQIPPRPQPAGPRKDAQRPAVPATPPANAVPATEGAGITPQPPCVPQAFRQPCEHCGHDVVFPFDPGLSAQLDWLTWLEDDPQPPQEGR
jgi:hypothetical protein